MAAKLTNSRKAGNGGNGRALAPTDNQPTRAEIEAGERLQLLSYLGKLTAEQKEIDAAKVVFDAAKGVQLETFRLAKAAGFQRKELQELLTDMNTRTKNLVEAEQRRRRFRDHVGLPTGAVQMSIFDSDTTPQEVKDSTAWRGDGYAAGLRGDWADAPEGIPPRFIQDWLAGHGDGQKVIIEAMASTAKVPEPEPTPKPEPTAEELEEAERRKPKPTVESVFGEQAAPDPAEGVEETAPEAGGEDPAEVVDEPAAELIAEGV